LCPSRYRPETARFSARYRSASGSPARPCNTWIVGGKAPQAARLRQARRAASLYKMRRCGSGAFDVRYTFNSGAKPNVAGCPSWGLGCVWQGGQGMRIMTVAFALGTALVLCNPGTFSVAAHAQKAKVVRQPRERPIITVPVVKTTPYWDYYIVPRYRYRPEDDRVDPCGGPVVPVISYGPQEETVPLWLANALGLGRVHGRDWPCKGQSR
jgi:hypothetical protein